MIREQEFFHGAVLMRLISRASEPLDIRTFRGRAGSYVINGEVGLYIKYSTHRMSPWRFTFRKTHQDEIAEMKQAFRQAFLVLVCETDGIAALSYDELKMILDKEHSSTEWVSATRRKGQQYRIKGSDGTLDFKIAESDFHKKVFDTLGLSVSSVTEEPVA